MGALLDAQAVLVRAVELVLAAVLDVVLIAKQTVRLLVKTDAQVVLELALGVAELARAAVLLDVREYATTDAILVAILRVRRTAIRRVIPLARELALAAVWSRVRGLALEQII